MMWIIIIIISAIIVFLLVRFFTDLDRDNYDLKEQTFSEKFYVVVNMISEVAFNGKGKIITFGKRSFNLYQEGQNQVIHFQYHTGHLTITWKYKYYQKEIVLKKQFDNVRNLSIFEQEKIGNSIIKEMEVIVANHKKNVSDGI